MDRFTITVQAGSGGTVAPPGPVTLDKGGSQAFVFTPAWGCELEQVTFNGTDVTDAVLRTFAEKGSYEYVVENISCDAVLGVSFGDSPIRDVDRAYVKANKDNGGFVLVDVRPAEYYDGKSFTPGTVAGGHIAGAINVPLAVIESSSAADLAALGIGADKIVILYCNSGKTSRTAAEALVGKGYDSLRNYVGSMNDWGSDPAETVVIAGLDLALGGEDTGVVSVDVPAGTEVRWSITSGAGVVELDSSAANPVGVRALGAGEAVLTAAVDGIAGTECTVTVTGTGSGGSGCDLGFAPAAVLLLIPLMLLRK